MPQIQGKMLPPGFVKVLRPEVCALKPCNKHVTAQLVSRSEYPSDVYPRFAVRFLPFPHTARL